MTRRSALLAILSALLMVSFSAALRPSTAAAGAYTLNLCASGPAIPEHHEPWDTHSSSAWGLVNHCPDTGYVLSMVAPATRFEEAPRFTLGLPDGVESVAVRISGDDGGWAGVRQGLRVCDLSGLICGRLQRPSDGERVVMRAGTEDFPPYPARMLSIDAVCEGAPFCDQAGEVIFSDLEVSLSDDTLPQLSFSPETDGWFRERTVLVPLFEDDDSGVHRLRIPGLDYDYETGCADIEAHVVKFFCAAAELPMVVIDPETFPEGARSYTAEFFDGAGNGSERNFEVKLDSVAPSAPRDLHVVGALDGWIGSPVVDLEWTNGDERLPDVTDSGLANARLDFRRPGTLPPGQVSTIELPAGELDRAGLTLPGAGDWEVGVTLIDHAGNKSERASLRIPVDEQPPSMPAIDLVAPIGAEAASRGVAVGWRGLHGGWSGVCRHSELFDSQPASQPGDDALVAAPGARGFVQLTPGRLAELPDGRHHLHLRTFSCAGVPGPAAHRPVLLDRLAPELSARPRSGITVSPDPVALFAREPDSEAVNSGVKSVEHRIGAAVPVESAGATAAVTLAEGENSVLARTTDRAGNSSPWREFRVIRDTLAPRLSIEPFNASDPTIVRASAEDFESGVVEVAIEIRSVSGGDWRRISTTLTGGSAEARIPDDGMLPDGRYLLRVVARDAAGHASIAVTRSDGTDASFELPLRSRSSLSLRGISRTLAPSGTVPLAHDEKLRVTGVLRLSDGAPLAGRRIEMVERRQGVVARILREFTTGADGRFRASIAPGVSRRIEFRFGGDDLAGVAEAGVELRTRAKIRLSSDRRILKGRGLLNLHGQIDISRVPMPAEVMYVTVRPLGVRDKRQLLRVPVASDGSFVATVAYSARPGRVNVRYRARVGRAAGWPFEPAQSNVVKMELRK